jgi:hypothetical protein
VSRSRLFFCRGSVQFQLFFEKRIECEIARSILRTGDFLIIPTAGSVCGEQALGVLRVAMLGNVDRNLRRPILDLSGVVTVNSVSQRHFGCLEQFGNARQRVGPDWIRRAVVLMFTRLASKCGAFFAGVPALNP